MQAWQAERARRLAHYRRLPTIEDEGLTLGPQIVVAKRTVDRWGAPRLAVDGDEHRVLALLAVAAAAGYTLEQALTAAGPYNRNFGNPQSRDTSYGIKSDAVKNITNGWHDTRDGKW